ncbi:hypothetical protein D3C81_825850 [compost metagenome]
MIITVRNANNVGPVNNKRVRSRFPTPFSAIISIPLILDCNQIPSPVNESGSGNEVIFHYRFSLSHLMA